jgi:hypothetical protein
MDGPQIVVTPVASFPAVLASITSGKFGSYKVTFEIAHEDKDEAWKVSDFVDQIVQLQVGEITFAAKPAPVAEGIGTGDVG